MSDGSSHQRSEHDGESLKCFICNQSGMLVTVTPWKDTPINLDSGSGQMFTLLPGTNITLQYSDGNVNILLIGDPVLPSVEPTPIAKSVELALTANMSINLGIDELMQITLIAPVHHTQGGIVKCGDGSD
ncbi:MAG: hypothetical protein JOZ51_07430 [Chloroflexi bacterium]|nr:hypothetical protein [Chloroflexota bacterium]